MRLHTSSPLPALDQSIDRREFERHPGQMPVRILMISSGGDKARTEMEGTIANLSPGGLGLVSSDSLDQDQLFRRLVCVQFTSAVARRTLVAYGRVVRCASADDGGSVVGIALSRPIHNIESWLGEEAHCEITFFVSRT